MIPRTLFSSDHETFRDTVRKFLENEAVPFNEEWEQQGVVPKDVWLKAGEQGFLCPMVGEEYGGIGADFLYSVVITEEISRLGLTGIGWGLHTEIVAPYIEHNGSEVLKQKYLPKMVTGEMIGAIAMTEPGAGSDLQGVKTTASYYQQILANPDFRSGQFNTSFVDNHPELLNYSIKRKPGELALAIAAAIAAHAGL